MKRRTVISGSIYKLEHEVRRRRPEDQPVSYAREWRICLTAGIVNGFGDSRRTGNDWRSKQLPPDRMILGERISGVGRDDVTDPTQCSATTNPETGCNDQPEDAGQYATVVKLPDSRN